MVGVLSLFPAHTPAAIARKIGVLLLLPLVRNICSSDICSTRQQGTQQQLFLEQVLRPQVLQGQPPRQLLSTSAINRISKMPKYKLTYFDCKGRGEITRMLFKVAGVDFEDKRIGLLEDGLTPVPEWDEFKKKTPFGQIPILEVDGEMLAQSHAIERYLARQFGLDGGTSLEKAKVDMWIEAADEILIRLGDHMEIEDEKRKTEDETKIKTVNIPLVFGSLSKTLEASKSGFIVGDKLTVADLAFVVVRDWLGSVWPKDGIAQINPYKQVADHILRIEQVPAIAAWLKIRPKTVF